MSYKIQVVDKKGRVYYVRHGDKLVVFRTREKAQEQAEFLREGVGDEYQSISVLRCPPYQADRGGTDA